jgi:hypothetical protein
MSQQATSPALLARRRALLASPALLLVLLPGVPRADNPPLFGPNIVPPQAEHVAAGCIASGAAVEARGWCIVAGILEGTHPNLKFWEIYGPLSTRPGRMRIGAATLFLSGLAPQHGLPTGLGEIGLLEVGHSDDELDNCWTLIDTDKWRPLPKMFAGGEMNDVIQDERGIFEGTLESEAYTEILIQAHYTSSKAFARQAKRDLTYAQIFAEPKKYRGEVIHIQGKLGRLARLDPPGPAVARGVTDLFEAWIFYDAQHINPFCALFTELPPQLRPFLGEKHLSEKKIDVSFDGYFYKRFRYIAGDSKPGSARDAPVFIGRALVVRTVPEAVPEDPWGYKLMVALVGFVGFCVILIILLTWWFRRHDEKARRRLSAVRDASLILPTPDTPPEGAFSPAAPVPGPPGVPENGTHDRPRWGTG